MKKYLALALAIVLCLGLFVGCGSSKATPSASTSTSASPAASAASASSDLYKQATGKTYTVGTDTTFYPFEFEDESGNRAGIDYDLCNAIAAKMGFKVTWNVLGFTAACAALESGQVDSVMAGMSITDERKAKYDFSDSYYNSAVAVTVAADSKFASLDDLKNQAVVVKTGTTGAKYAESIADKYGLKLTYVDDSSTMYTTVTSGQAMACFEDYPVMMATIANRGVKCKVIAKSDSSDPYGFAVIKGKNPELIAAFNEGLKELKSDGTYDKIIAKYLGTTK